MGVKGFATFMEHKFTGWKSPTAIQECSHLIIDGSNICYKLYKDKCDWSFGGEYDKFSHVVKEFFEEARFNHPIVIFDGPRYDDKKDDTVRNRRDQSLVELHDSQCANDKLGNTSVATLFPISVFRNVLTDLGIKFHTANGDADNLIAALANHHKCPVLSSDSDFFLFPLKCGVIYFDRYCNKETRRYSLFNIDEFKRQFRLQEYEQCLMIPTFFGNDFIKYPDITKEPFERHLQRIASYNTCKEYMASGEHNIYRVTLRENFKLAKEFYSDLKLPSDLSDEYVLMKHPCASAFPDWVFKAKHFPSHLLSVYHRKSYLLPRVVEVIKMSSAWEMSRHIRRFLYGIVGIPNVTEVIRKSSCSKLEEVFVSHKSTEPSISISDLTSIDGEKSSNLVLSILISEDAIKHIFNALPDDEWKLPLAATFYWYQHLDIPLAQRSDLLKSLLLIFLRRFPEKEYPLLPRQPDTTEKYWTALHAFAQWQCVYYDATALDCIAREPFPVTSPAFLYSGEVVMYYATMNDDREKEIRKMVDGSGSKKDSKDRELFGNFLYLVTGEDEYSGRRGKHNAINQQ